MKKQFLGFAVLCIIAVVAAPFTSYGADKLLVKDGSSNTQFVVTDTGQMALGGGALTAANYAAEVLRTAANASLVINRTDGAKNFINATATAGNFGTVNNFPVRLLINSSARQTINTDNSVAWANGAAITAGGTVQNASSREYKENISELSVADAEEALKGLNPVLYNYKVDKNEHHVGFIAEDVPALVASKDRKSLSPMDIVAVLTKVVQEKSQVVEAQQLTLDKLAATVAMLEAEINKLKSKDMTAQK